MDALAAAWIATIVWSTVHALLVVVLARGLGARVEAAQVMIGPVLLRRRVRGVELRIAAVPLPSSYVRFAPVEEEPAPARPGAARAAPRTTLEELSAPRRVAVVAGPWLGVLLLCTLALGPADALASAGRGFVQLVHGAACPYEVGAGLVGRLVELARRGGPLVFGAALGTKLVALNLLPLAGFSGQHALYRAFSDRPSPPTWMTVVGLLLSAGFVLGWSLAVIAHATAD